MSERPRPDEAAALLAEAEGSRANLAGRITLPPGYHAWIGAGVAVQIGTAAVGIAVSEAWARSLLLVGIVFFGLLAGVLVSRFRSRNGVWVHGFVSRAVLGTAAAASIAYAAALAAAVAAAFRDLWWLVALCALGGGVGYALSGRRWLRAYQQDPAGNARAESALLLGVLVLLGVGGFVLLLAAA